MCAVRWSSLGALVALTLVLVLLQPAPALAYLDPGTGSFLFQAITAGVITGLFVLRSSWQRLRERFRRFLGPRGGG
jgi:hypothetical protein